MPDLETLAKKIRKLYGCTAKHTGTVSVFLTFKDIKTWEGTVHEFSVRHPEAPKCYAWVVKGKTGRQYVTVLGKKPITSPSNAVEKHLANRDQQTRLK